ncbi:MAG: glycosyl hydrolase 53 family protein [Chitinispirillaceae bacterium]|nr:glycosyl hydrolase 53 family protein [Chitinispirillaceae bacterium]
MVGKTLCALLSAGSVLSAASLSVSISGTIKDTGGTAIPGVKVSLANHSAITATTDDEGTFLLIGEFPLTKVAPYNITLQNAVTIAGGTNSIRFFITADGATGAVSLFAANGVKIEGIDCENLSAGAHSVPLPRLGNGFYLVKIDVDDHSSLCKLIVTGTEMYIGSVESNARRPRLNAAAKRRASEYVDTIVAAKSGYTTVKRPIDSYSLNDVKLVMSARRELYDCPLPNPNLFAIGMDLSFDGSQSASSRASTLKNYKSHGINYVRLRTFVDPKATDGYDKANGNCDLKHTIEFGRQIKEECMGLLVDFHFSNNWADPGKQCVPVDWQDAATIEEMAELLYEYTKDAIEQLIAGGARPDMVQLGNETTPGILVHRCDSEGLPLRGIAGYNPVNGALYFWSSTDNGAPSGSGASPGGWKNLGKLLNEAARAVQEIDPDILLSLHLDRGNDLASSRNFLKGALDAGVPVDVFGESCYAGVQGQPSDWKKTFDALATSFPEVKFMIAEYSGEQRATNDVMYNLADMRGIGTFNWAPRPSGSFFTVYDQLVTDYADRL